MADILDKVIDIAKKLRKSAKKVSDPSVQDLITDLNLSLADLKVQLVEQRETARNPQPEDTTASAPSAPSLPAPATPVPSSSDYGLTQFRP